MINFDNKFDLNQKVKIIPFDDMEARIDGIYYDARGFRYYVYFYINCEEKTGYFFEDELKAV